MPTVAQEAASRIEEQLGVKIDVIENMDWDQLMQAGVTVKLHIGRWRAEKTRTLADTGIVLQEEERPAWYNFVDPSSLGTMKLLPIDIVKRMNSIENAAREALRTASINTRWGYFLPIGRFPEWLAKDREREARYLAIRQDLYERYAEIRAAARQAYREAARGVYRRSNGKTSDAPIPEEFCEQFADSVTGTFASQDSLRDSMYWQREIGFLPIPSLMAQEQANRERILAETQLNREQRELLQSLNADFARDAYRAKKAIVVDFLSDVKAELAQRIQEVTSDVIAAIQKNNRLPASSLTGIRNLVSAVEGLNLIDDEQITRAMADLRARTNVANANSVDVGALMRTLRTVNAEARESLEKIVVRNPRSIMPRAEVVEQPALRPQRRI